VGEEKKKWGVHQRGIKFSDDVSTEMTSVLEISSPSLKPIWFSCSTTAVPEELPCWKALMNETNRMNTWKYEGRP
jgi:hypothetical protein